MKLLALLLFPAADLLCQPGPASTKGNCSPAITGHGNTINIDVKSCGMSDGEVAEWRSSLKQILAKQIDPKVLLALLDDIKNGQIRIENGVLRIENKVAEIQDKQAPRDIDRGQQTKLKELLFGHPHKVTVVGRADDHEAMDFADKLAKALNFAGWDAGEPMMGALSPFAGVLILVRNPRFPEAALLQSSLRSVGIEASGRTDSSIGDGVIEIRVGSKP
jgi:hypothetical protein